MNWLFQQGRDKMSRINEFKDMILDFRYGLPPAW